MYEWSRLTSVFRVQNSLGLPSTAFLDQNHHDIRESLLLCPEKEMRARTKLSYGRTASHHNSRYSYFSLSDLPFSFFLPADVKAYPKGKRWFRSNILVSVWTREGHSVWTLCALWLGFYINGGICTKFIVYDTSSSNILYPLLSYPSLTFSHSHGPCTAPLQKSASRAPAKPGLGSLPRNILKAKPCVVENWLSAPRSQLPLLYYFATKSAWKPCV